MFTLLIFIAVLAVLVLSHEWGHFIAARKSGMKVYEFGFGFPPRLFGWYKDPVTKKWVIVGRKFKREDAPTTLYSLNLLPLGGFVSIKGENHDETGSDSFNAQKAWKRAITLSAGVVMNVVLAAVLLSIGLMIGLPQSVDSIKDTSLVRDRRLEIMQVRPDSPAAKAGIQSGDVLLKVGDLTEPRLLQMQEYISESVDKEIPLTIKRGEETVSTSVIPEVRSETGRGGIGVALAEIGTVKYPWYQAIWQGIIYTGWYIKAIILGFGLLIKGLFTGGGAAEAVTGPVGIAVMTGQAARMGIAYLIQFTALLSLNLAVLNIIPFPALDGGRLLFLGISKVIRRPVSEKWEQIAHTIGFLLLMLLVVVVTVKDISSFGGAIANFFKNIF